jgi:hypothetical protein
MSNLSCLARVLSSGRKMFTKSTAADREGESREEVQEDGARAGRPALQGRRDREGSALPHARGQVTTTSKSYYYPSIE